MRMKVKDNGGEEVVLSLGLQKDCERKSSALLTAADVTIKGQSKAKSV